MVCTSGTDEAIDISVSGGVLPYSYSWSNMATTEDISGLEANTYNVTVTDANGCTATESIDIEVNDILAPVPVCQDITVQLAANGEVTISASDIDNGSYDQNISLDYGDLTTFYSLNINNQGFGNYVGFVGSTEEQVYFASVNAIDNKVRIGDELKIKYKGSNTSIVDRNIYWRGNGNAETDVTWESSNSKDVYVLEQAGKTNGDLFDPKMPYTIKSAFLINGVEKYLSILGGDVTFTDDNSLKTYYTIDVVSGSLNECSTLSYAIDNSTFDCSMLGVNTVTLTVTDTSGNSDSCTATVTVEDNTNPTANCVSPFTIALDATGNASITAADINNGSSDNCGIDTTAIDITDFDCTMIGANTVTLTVTDASGNTDTCSTTVTIEDITAPTPDQTTITLVADQCEILATDITAPTATDNCGGTVIVTNDATFPITAQGTTVITWSYEDENGNISTQTQNVYINDISSPTPDAATLANITAECEVLATDVTAPTATDNCGGMVTVTNDATFPISTQGTTVITWSYEDVNGNISTQTQNVVIDDVTSPVADQAALADITMECEVLASDVPVPTATDNCGGTVSVTNDATFPITSQGTTIITWSYEDENGNISTQTQNIVIDDVTAPTPDQTTLADITMECEVLASDVINPTATDNCGGSVTVTNDVTFPITSQGTTIITWSYEDENGNTSTQTQNVVIDDVTAPVADQSTLANITAECEVLATDVTAPTATDNCGGMVSVTNDASFPISTQGTTVITWSYEDVNGNISTQTQNVVIDDVTAPVADQSTLANITTECEVLATDVTAPTATDNCSGTVTVTNDATFPISTQGTTIITWSYEDANGNISTQTQNVVIDDVTAPVADQATLADITMECEVLASDVPVPTATDNCGGTITVTNDASFPISTQGTTVITWSYEDENGNTSTQTQNIHVLVSPIAGVTIDDATVTYDGSVHTIAVNNLPTDASVSYSTAPSTGTPNGATDAGTYTITAIVTPPATAVNCDPITLTASLTIDQAPQTIDFDALPVMMLEDDPDFQLQATASSGLPVEYTYTYTAANPPATVTPAGWVSLLTSGSINITAAQPGNSNYLPAIPVTQTLQINSRDASAHSVNIAGVTYDEPESEIYYLIECSDDQDQVSVDFETETNATVNPSHNFTMETPTPGIYRQEVVITSQDGSTTQTYMVVIEKMFPFFEIVEQKFDNVLLVNNNPTNNGGYRFVDYEWYQNGQFLGNEQYYSAGPNTTDNLDPDTDYYVRMELENGDILQTCIGNVTLVHDFSASIFPNPNESGKQLNIEIYEVQISAEHPLAIQLYSLQGIEVGNWRTNRNITTINLPETLAAGVYIVKCTAGRNIRTFKLIIE